MNIIVWMWIFVIIFALHEVEEWNILNWYEQNFVNLPPSTYKATRVWIVFIILVAFVWCLLGTLPGVPSLAAYLLLPAVAIALQNAFQHVYWQIYFKQYAPGIITAFFGLIPIGISLYVVSVFQNYVPVWYEGIFIILIIPGIVQTVKAKNEMTPQIRAIHMLGIKMTELLDRKK